MIDRVGLHEVARKRVGKFSLGMGQRLGIAAALLADPQILILDEPANGLDPEGIQWIRNLLKELAAEGRTVFVSSHLMSEMALTAEHLIVIGRGRLIADLSVEEFLRQASKDRGARPLAPRDGARRRARGPGRHRPADRRRRARDGRADRRADRRARPRRTGSSCTSSRRCSASLEEAFMDVTRDDVEYHGRSAPASRASPRRRSHERRCPATPRDARLGSRPARHPGARDPSRSGRSSARCARRAGRCSSRSCSRSALPLLAATVTDRPLVAT